MAIQGRHYSGKRYDLGLQKDAKTGSYNMIADWWGVNGSLTPDQRSQFGGNESDIQDALLRKTTKHDLIDSYALQGFVAQVQENEDKSINVTLTRGF